MSNSLSKEKSSYVWKDGKSSVGTGELLSAIIQLTESEKKVNELGDKRIADYLLAKGYIKRDEDGFSLVEEHRNDMISLGNEISNAIGEEIQEYVDNNDTEGLLPTIMMMMPTQHKNDDKK